MFRNNRRSYFYILYNFVVTLCLIIVLLVCSFKKFNNTELPINMAFIDGEIITSSNGSISKNVGHIIASVIDANGQFHTYGNKSPFIFIDGFPRSGTTLLRAILDTHTNVRCGPETAIIREMVELGRFFNVPLVQEYYQARISDEAIDNAVTSFILQIIVHHGLPASRLCNKDPLTLLDGVYMKKLFPNCKFIMMIRDGRASVMSMMERHVDVEGYEGLNYTSALKRWSKQMKVLFSQCNKIGSSSCLMVKYEDLILHPRAQVQRILNYLQLPWEESLLHHQLYINQPNGIELAPEESSTSQVIEPLYLKALYKWIDSYPHNLTGDEVAKIAPMLQKIGYDPYQIPPNYGEPDPFYT